MQHAPLSLYLARRRLWAPYLLAFVLNHPLRPKLCANLQHPLATRPTVQSPPLIPLHTDLGTNLSHTLNPLDSQLTMQQGILFVRLFSLHTFAGSTMRRRHTTQHVPLPHKLRIV